MKDDSNGRTARGWAVIADALTGAIEAGVAIAGGRSAELRVGAGRFDGSAAVIACSTDTREGAGALAAERAGEMAAAAAGSGRSIYKKIDSTLRGPFGAGIESTLERAGLAGALICPALPEQGRTVVGGELRVGGQVGTPASVADSLGEAFLPEVISLGRDQADGAFVAGALRTAAGPVAIVADALDDGDLRRWAEVVTEVNSAEQRLVPVGSVGLAGALGAVADGEVRHELPRSRVAIGVVGSKSPESRAQVRRAAERGARVLALDPAGSEVDGRAWRDRLSLDQGGRLVLTIVEDCRPGLAAEECEAVLARAADQALRANPDAACLMSGGETARAVLGHLGADALSLLGRNRYGVSFARASLPGIGERVVMTKPGAFGPPDALADCLEEVIA